MTDLETAVRARITEQVDARAANPITNPERAAVMDTAAERMRTDPTYAAGLSAQERTSLQTWAAWRSGAEDAK